MPKGEQPSAPARWNRRTSSSASPLIQVGTSPLRCRESRPTSSSPSGARPSVPAKRGRSSLARDARPRENARRLLGRSWPAREPTHAKRHMDLLPRRQLTDEPTSLPPTSETTLSTRSTRWRSCRRSHRASRTVRSETSNFAAKQTVTFRLTNIYRKQEAASRREAAVRAVSLSVAVRAATRTGGARSRRARAPDISGGGARARSGEQGCTRDRRSNGSTQAPPKSRHTWNAAETARHLLPLPETQYKPSLATSLRGK